MVSVSSTAFERLANRPPTPPKDQDNKDIDDALQFLAVDYTLPNPDSEQDADQTTLATSSPAPASSPPSSSDKEGRDRSVKRVEFSPCVTAHKPTPFGSTSRGSPLLKRLHSNKTHKPLKSILKSTFGQETPTPDGIASPTPDYFSITDLTASPDMLESVVKLLASASPASRLDGYRTINFALKGSEGLVDIAELRAKMTLFAQFIARDISSATATSSNITESTMTTQALKLATAILLMPDMNGCFNEDFQGLLVDRSIEVISREDSSKTLANHHMFLLASQRFTPKVMTIARAEQIVAALSTIHNRVSGNSVVSARLVIIQRLIEQLPNAMLASIRDWLPHIFHGTLSSIKDVRSRAVEAGTLAGVKLGTHFQATKALMDLFGTSTTDGTQYGDYLTARMSDMVKKKDYAGHVPMIWSIVISFFKAKKIKLLHWGLFKKAWLLIIQKCMNSGDAQVRYRANMAWNKLIYVISPDKETMNTMDGFVHMLKIPFVSAFDKKDKDKQARQLAVSGYCHLLHYSLRPSQSHEELDIYWDEYVHPIITKLLNSTPRDASLACRILRALFNSPQKVWNEDLANEPVVLTPEDLPRMDSQWIRSRVHKILHLITPHISAVLASPIDNKLDKTPWRDLLIAIAEAGSQEVRASVDLREALAHFMNFFGTLWNEAARNFREEPAGLWISRFGLLVQCAVDELGALQFGESHLLRNEAESFEAAPTPSHRPSKHHSVLQSPVAFLFGLFKQPTVIPNDDYYQVAKGLLHKICGARVSRKTRVHLLRQCSDFIGQDLVTSAESSRLWSILAQECATTLVDPDIDQTAQEPQRLGNQIRDTVHILTLGFRHCATDPTALTAWQELYAVSLQQLKQDAGEGAAVLGLMEPTSEALLKAKEVVSAPVLVQMTTTIVNKGGWPKNRQQMDDGRKALWNTSLTHSRHAIFEPFVHVLALVNSTMQEAYGTLDESKSYTSLLATSIAHFVVKSPASQLHTTLRKMQEGLSLLVKDEARCIVSSDETLQQLSFEILSLWQAILRLLKGLPSNGILLKALDPLIAAGLNSSHRTIVNATVTFWNETFGKLDSLVYPPSVEFAIRRVKPLVELELPTFPAQADDECPPPLADFVDSQTVEDSEPADTQSRKTRSTRGKSPLSKSKAPASLVAVRNTPRRSGRTSERVGGSSTPRPATSRPKTKAKLRHEDSQVQFVAVPSSSPPAAEESQLLTDHQKEVNSRQRFQTAQLYPDFSSSPAPMSTRSKSRMPRLDFSTQISAPEDYATPTFEDHGPMDDYLTSSPTPKAAEKARSKLNQTTLANEVEESKPFDDDVEEAAEDSDIPSSPPQGPDDTDYGDLPDISTIESGGVQLYETDRPPIESTDMQLDTKQASIEPSRLQLDPKEQTKQNPPPEAGYPTEASTILDVEAQAAGEAESIEGDHSDSNSHEPATKDEAQVKVSVETTAEDRDGVQKGASVGSSHVQESDVFVDAPTDFVDEKHVEQDRDVSSSPFDFTDSIPDLPSANAAVATHQDQETANDVAQAVQAHDDGPADQSHVDDSFIDNKVEDQATRPDEDVKESQISQPSSQRRSKRKRSENVSVTPIKRRRKSAHSPLKQLLSWVTGSQDQTVDEDDDEVMGDCIAVASQPAQPAELHETPIAPSSAPASVDSSKPKRGRGRPRKSGTPVANTPPAETPTTRPLKRKSSVLSTNSDKSIAVDAPGLEGGRRVTRSQGQTPVVEVPRTGRRTTNEVVIPAAESSHREVQLQESDQEGVDESANSQLQLEQEVAVQRDRVIAKPRSIMAKLKSILSDCKTLVLGSQEYWELDEVLIEVKREVHEAARRGRE